MEDLELSLEELMEIMGPSAAQVIVLDDTCESPEAFERVMDGVKFPK